MRNHNMATKKGTKKRAAGGKAKKSKTKVQQEREEKRRSPRVADKRKARDEEEEDDGLEDDVEYSDEERDQEAEVSPPKKPRKEELAKVSSQEEDDDEYKSDDDSHTTLEEQQGDDDRTTKLRAQKSNPEGKQQKPNGKKGANPQAEAPEVELARLKKRLAMQEMPKTRGLPSATNTKDLDAAERDVVKKTNVHLWQMAKVIKNQQYLGKAVRFVMKLHNPIKFQGLGPKALALAQEEWARVGGGNENLVRTGINQQRNYCLNEIRDYYKPKFRDEKDEDVPTAEEIYDIAMRKGMEEGDETKERYEKLFVIYWEILLVKAAGVHYW